MAEVCEEEKGSNSLDRSPSRQASTAGHHGDDDDDDDDDAALK